MKSTQPYRRSQPSKQSFVDLFRQARQKNAQGLFLTDAEYTNGNWSGTYSRSRGNANNRFSFDNFGEFQRDIAYQQRQDLRKTNPKYAQSQWYKIVNDIFEDSLSGIGTSYRSSNTRQQPSKQYSLVDSKGFGGYRLDSGKGNTSLTDTTSNIYDNPAEAVIQEQLIGNITTGVSYSQYSSSF